MSRFAASGRVLLGRALLVTGAYIALGVPPGLAQDPADGEPDAVMVEMGLESFVRYCASCHGADAKGKGPAAGALATPPADLTRIAARRDGEFPAGEIARFIDGRFALAAHGSREMPVWGQRFGERIPEAGVSEEIVRGRIYVLVEYLKSIQASD